jgi:hypothetical protein
MSICLSIWCYLVLFGAICPATGATEATEATVTPYVNKEAMRQHLQPISQATPIIVFNIARNALCIRRFLLCSYYELLDK